VTEDNVTRMREMLISAGAALAISACEVHGTLVLSPRLVVMPLLAGETSVLECEVL
jgi:hypothetical protein